MKPGDIVVLSHNSNMKNKVGSVAEIVDPLADRYTYCKFCNWLRDTEAMETWPLYICVRWLSGSEAPNGFYMANRFRPLVIQQQHHVVTHNVS